MLKRNVKDIPTTRKHIAEAVHRAVCEFTQTNGFRRCLDYALAGHTLANALLGREYVLQAGGLYIMADPPNGVTAMESGDFEQGELDRSVGIHARLERVLRRRRVMPTAASIYYGSNGGASRSFCSTLERLGQFGRIAAQLFRVQKASSRAKVYRGEIKRAGGIRESYRVSDGEASA